VIVILLAAYNGEKFIRDQIESILTQTYTDWRLVIQDDCSTDSTYDIALQYAAKYPEKISSVSRYENSGGAANNFFSMLKYAAGDYMMFSDNDDIWLPEKISVTLDKMHELEAKFGITRPLLVHTDLQVVDSQLHVISESLLKRQNLDCSNRQLNHLLAQNVVTGCTLMANRQLLGMVGDSPMNAVMHDWWLALIAAAFGEIGFVKQPTILYRQHGANQVGAPNTKSVGYYIKRLLDIRRAQQDIYKSSQQAKEFFEHYENALDPDKAQMVKDFISLPEQSVFGRLYLLNRYDFWKTGFLRRCIQLLLPPYRNLPANSEDHLTEEF
jgi:glycosyltransferase involved in cell wall biosynthesis